MTLAKLVYTFGLGGAHLNERAIVFHTIIEIDRTYTAHCIEVAPGLNSKIIAF